MDSLLRINGHNSQRIYRKRTSLMKLDFQQKKRGKKRVVKRNHIKIWRYPLRNIYHKKNCFKWTLVGRISKKVVKFKTHWLLRIWEKAKLVTRQQPSSNKEIKQLEIVTSRLGVSLTSKWYGLHCIRMGREDRLLGRSSVVETCYLLPKDQPARKTQGDNTIS